MDDLSPVAIRGKRRCVSPGFQTARRAAVSLGSNLGNRAANLRRALAALSDEIDGEIVYFDFEEGDGRLILRFDADRIPLEQVVQYAFRDLKAMDMKIAEISIGDVVKTILEQQEAEHAEKV